MIPHLTSLYYPTSNILQDEKKKEFTVAYDRY